jgi:hypothetical protein
MNNDNDNGLSSAIAMLYLSKNIRSLLTGSNTVILTDADVDSGNILHY